MYALQKKLSFGLLLTTMAALCASCTEGQAPSRVLLVGIDGADPQVIDQLFENKRLPILQRLAREGVHGRLKSHLPLWSPRIWASIATGKSPEKHGILNFLRIEANDQRRLYRSDDRAVHALWNIASDLGYTVGVVNWWTTYPPEKINGVMISDHAIPGAVAQRHLLWKVKPDLGPRASVVFPSSHYDRLMAIVHDEPPLMETPSPFEESASFPDWVQLDQLNRAFREDDLIVRLALDVELTVRPDVFMVFLPGIDRVSHWLWGNLEAPELYPKHLRPSARGRRTGSAALLAYYEYTDRLLGQLLAPYGPDDLVMVVSDHGFEAGVRFKYLTGVHETENAQNGVIFARGRGIPVNQEGRGPDGPLSVNDVAPTILAWMGLPAAADMDGLPALFASQSPTRTISTYDTTVIERLAGTPSSAEEDIVDRLRVLGYIE